MREPCKTVQVAERGQQLQKQPERCVDPRGDAGVHRGVENLGEPSAGDELGHNGQAAFFVGPDFARVGEAFVFDRRQRGDAFAQHLLKGAQLGAEDQALEHAAGLAIEREDTAPESILVTGGRERRIGRESGSGHRLKRLRLCNPRTIGTVCVSAAYPSIDKVFTRTGRRRQAAEVTKSVRGCQSCNCGKVARMTNPGEVDALKAAMRGARQTGEQVLELVPRVEALDSRADFPDADLDDLRRVSSAHAVAAQALRGLVETMLRRRGKIVDEATGGSSGGDAE